MRYPGIVLMAALSAAPCVSLALPPGPHWSPGFPLRTTETTVLLMWFAVPGASEYSLSREKGAEGFREIYRGAGNYFQDDDAPSSADFVYKVTAIRGGERTGPSPPAKVAAERALTAPEITGSITMTGSIRLRWMKVPGAAYYNVYRSEGLAGADTLIASPGLESHADLGVQPGTVYRYKVSAVGRLGRESPKSVPYLTRYEDRESVPRAGAPKTRGILSWKRQSSGERDRFDQPAAIITDRRGDLYVLERGGIQVFGPAGEFKGGTRFPKGWGRASGLAADQDNTVAVAFFAEELVRVIDNTGMLVREIRYPRGDNGVANSPIDVAVDELGDYWIVDGNRGQVIRQRRASGVSEAFGRERGSYPSDDISMSDFPSAKNVRFNPNDGKIYVILSLLAQVRVIDPGLSRVIRSFGRFGPGADEFQGIGGLGFKKNGNVLLFDHLMQSVKEFSADYRYVATHGDIQKDGNVRLSTNFASAFVYSEERMKFYVLSTLGNRLYVFDAAK